MEEGTWYENLWEDLKGWFAGVEGTLVFGEEGDVTGEVSFGRQGIPWQFVMVGLLVLVFILIRQR